MGDWNLGPKVEIELFQPVSGLAVLFLSRAAVTKLQCFLDDLSLFRTSDGL